MWRAIFGLAVVSLCVLTSAARTAEGPVKRALLVGISRYYQHGPRPWPALHAKEDVEALRRALVLRFEFPQENIAVLLDEQATAAGIRQAFRRELIDKARPGDVVLFHFSGHGQQLADDNGDEPDGLDESLVPFDATDHAAAAGARTNLRDDEVAAWLEALSVRMREGGKLRGNITVTIDSCFSGTATRERRTARGRGWDEAVDGPRPQAVGRVLAETGSGLLPDGQTGALEYVVLSAARSDQRARERDGMGVFSRALIDAILAERPGTKTTYRTLRERIARDVLEKEREQEPQVEGAAELTLFSDTRGTTPQSAPPRVVKDARLWQLLSRLRRDSSKLPVTLQLCAVPAGRDARGHPECPASPPPRCTPANYFAPGSCMAISLRNGAKRPLYAMVLELSPDFEVTAFYPPPATADDEHDTFRLPPRFERMAPTVWRVDGKPGEKSRVKLIASERPLLQLAQRLAQGPEAAAAKEPLPDAKLVSTFETWLRIEAP